MIVELIIGESAFSELAEGWDDLAGRGMTATPFQSHNYQSTWWHHLHPPESRLVTVVIKDSAGILLGIAPLYITNDGTLHFNGCVEETDYLDIIVEARHAQQVWEAIFDCLFSSSFPAWSRLELCNIPEVSPTRMILPGLANDRDLTIVESIDEVCPIIPLPASFDAYLDLLDGKQRREVNRKLRRAAGAEMTMEIIGPDDDIQQAVDDFLALLQLSTHEKRDWLNEGRRALFQETAAFAQKNGTLQLMFLSIDEKKAAALFNFDYRNRIWVYNSGLDPQAFASLSPGVVLTAKAIEWAIENGRSKFDFLRGSETYKYRFGAADTSIYRLQMNRHSPG